MTLAVGIGACMALIAVVLGAFGAHALKDKFPEPRYAAIWETAVQYHMYHAIGLIGIGILGFDALVGATSTLQWASYVMVTGIIFFSGSLYLLAVTGVKKLGAITPLGGLFFIVAWALVISAVLQAS